jgi:hypothetical protein
MLNMAGFAALRPNPSRRFTAGYGPPYESDNWSAASSLLMAKETQRRENHSYSRKAFNVEGVAFLGQ